MPESTSPVPALASHAGAGGANAETPVGRCNQRIWSLVDDHGLRTPRRFERALGFGAGVLAEKLDELAFMRGQDGVVAVQSLRLTDQADRVGVDHDRPWGGQRQGQHLRHFAQSRPNQDAADPLVLKVRSARLDD